MNCAAFTFFNCIALISYTSLKIKFCTHINILFLPHILCSDNMHPFELTGIYDSAAHSTQFFYFYYYFLDSLVWNPTFLKVINFTFPQTQILDKAWQRHWFDFDIFSLSLTFYSNFASGFSNNWDSINFKQKSSVISYN